MKNVSDIQIRDYFLGKLPESEADDFEMECAADVELTEATQMVERELADDYLRGNLSAADARLFETNYLITEARRQKLAIAGGLWRIANDRPGPESLAATASPISFWQTIFGKGHRFQLVCSCLFLMLVGGAIFCYLSFIQVDKNDVAEVQDVNYPPPIENPTVKNIDANDRNLQTAPVNSVIPNKEINKTSALSQKTLPETKRVSTPKYYEKNVPGLAVFALLPGTLRDESEKSVTIAPNVKNVKLQLSLPEDAAKYEKYRAVLKTAEGDEVLPLMNLRALNFTVSAQKLENRTYIVFLEGQNTQGEFESITEYTFRVRR